MEKKKIIKPLVIAAVRVAAIGAAKEMYKRRAKIKKYLQGTVMPKVKSKVKATVKAAKTTVKAGKKKVAKRVARSA